MSTVSEEKKSAEEKTIDTIFDIALLPVDIVCDIVDSLTTESPQDNPEDYKYVSGRDYYKDKNLSDNYLVILSNNRIVAEGHTSIRGREGIWRDYSNYDGSKAKRIIEAEYRNGKKNGSYTETKTFANETWVTTGTYENNKKNGKFTTSKNKVPVYEETYKNDKIKESREYDESGNIARVSTFSSVALNENKSDATSLSPHAASVLAQNSTCITNADQNNNENIIYDPKSSGRV